MCSAPLSLLRWQMPWGGCTSARTSARSSSFLRPRRRRRSPRPALSQQKMWRKQKLLSPRRKKQPQRKWKRRKIEYKCWIEWKVNARGQWVPHSKTGNWREEMHGATNSLAWSVFIVFVSLSLSVIFGENKNQHFLLQCMRNNVFSDYKWLFKTTM